MNISIREILEKFPDLVAARRTAPEGKIRRLHDPLLAQSEDMIFVSTPKHLKEALESKAKTWLVHESLVDQVPESVTTLLTTRNVSLAIARIAKAFFPLTKHHQPIEGARISPHAHVSPSAKLGRDCIVGPGAVIGDRCQLGDRVIVGANAVLEPDVEIGTDSHIHPLVFIGHSCVIGQRCEIKPNSVIGGEGFGYAQDENFNHTRITHYGRVILGDDVHIGAGVQMDRGTYDDSRIGSGTKIDNHCHFGHNIQIGKNTLITGGMITAGSATIGSYSVFGGRVTVAGHLTIADRVQIGGLSGITKSVPKSGEYGGLPLQDIKDMMRTRASLKVLPGLVKQMRKVLRHLNLDDSDLKEKREE